MRKYEDNSTFFSVKGAESVGLYAKKPRLKFFAILGEDGGLKIQLKGLLRGCCLAPRFRNMGGLQGSRRPKWAAGALKKIAPRRSAGGAQNSRISSA